MREEKAISIRSTIKNRTFDGIVQGLIKDSFYKITINNNVYKEDTRFFDYTNKNK